MQSSWARPTARSTKMKHLEKGKITGITISIILFAIAMNMVVKAAELKCKGPLSRSGVSEPLWTIWPSQQNQYQGAGRSCREILITWARMSFKTSKSRPMVLKKGKVIDKLPSVRAFGATSQEPGKALWLQPERLSCCPEVLEELGGWLTKEDRSGLPGRFEAWIYQYTILPRVLWPPVCSPNNNFGIPRKKDQQLSTEVVGPQQLHCNVQWNILSAKMRAGRKWKAEKSNGGRVLSNAKSTSGGHSQKPKSASPRTRRDATHSRKKSREAWRKTQSSQDCWRLSWRTCR